MIPSIHSLCAFSFCALTLVHAQYPPELVGTWTTKSKKVITGPSFYNPVADRITEPELAGISYSFTQDGYYEEAYYRSIPNPTTPKCPSSILQWQHGVYSLPGNGSLVLQPFGVDGRQVMSSPCSYDEAVYTRYEQPELMKSYQVLTDPYHNVPRLNLFQFDGKPMQPMYLVLNPPQMLPTQTLNPTATATPTKKAKAKRDQEGDGDAEELSPEELAQKLLQQNHHQDAPLNKNVLLAGRKSELYNPDKFWWVGVGLVAVGTVLYMWPTKQEHQKYTRVESS